MSTLSLCAVYFATVIFLVCVANGNGQLAEECANTTGDCYFISGETDCHWNYTNWTVQKDSYGSYFLHLAPDSLTGKILSDWLCSTQSHNSCLRFDYKMNNEQNALLVYLTYGNSAATKLLLNVTEEAPKWKAVIIPVTATERFAILIAGEINPGSNNTGISVDNIDYQTSDCDAKTTTPTATVVENDTTSSPSQSWSHSATSTKGDTIKTNTEEASDSPTDNLILIIGVVVAGLVICIIIVVVCCLLRRRRSRPKKPDAQYTDAESPLAAMTKSEGAKYENWNAEGESKQLLTHRDPGHEDVTSKTLDANYELVEDSASASPSAADNDPLNTLYAKVNKPKPKGGHQDPDYTVPAPCQNVHSTGESSKEGNGTVDDTEYNALSFEAKMDVPRIEEEEAEVGRVYDRLQADDPGTYSHVQQEKNTSTHHPEYSHFGVGT